MKQLSVKVPDEVYERLRGRVTADRTITSQIVAAIEAYLYREIQIAHDEELAALRSDHHMLPKPS